MFTQAHRLISFQTSYTPCTQRFTNITINSNLKSTPGFHMGITWLQFTLVLVKVWKLAVNLVQTLCFP